MQFSRSSTEPSVMHEQETEAYRNPHGRFDILNEQYAALLPKRVVVYVHDQRRHGARLGCCPSYIETHRLRKGRPRRHRGCMRSAGGPTAPDRPT